MHCGVTMHSSIMPWAILINRILSAAADPKMQQKTSFSEIFPLWEILYIYESILGMYHIMFYALQNYRAPSSLFCLYTILYHIKSNWTFISAILTSKFPFFDKKFWQSCCDLDCGEKATQKGGFSWMLFQSLIQFFDLDNHRTTSKISLKSLRVYCLCRVQQSSEKWPKKSLIWSKKVTSFRELQRKDWDRQFFQKCWFLGF